MRKLTEEEIEKIVKHLKDGKPLPEDYKAILFETKKEYELVYADKEREEDILADTIAVPLQPVKTFRNSMQGLSQDLRSEARRIGTVPLSDYWTNLLIFGDNLQVLKTLLQMKQEGKLKNADGTPGVRLIYIDPPFATKQEFEGSQDQKAYQDKIAGTVFLEFLRNRFIFLREILSENGSIYVHLDYRLGHAIKIILDEVFGPPNFRNEISIRRKVKNIQQQFEEVRRLNIAFDSLFWYSKSPTTRFEPGKRDREQSEDDQWNNFFNNADRPTLRYPLLGINLTHGQWRWKRDRAERAVKNYREYLAKYSKEMSIYEYWVMTGKIKEFIKREPNSTRCYYWVSPKTHKLVDTNWFDIYGYDNSPGSYPTQKSEDLLYRIIKYTSEDGDLVLDCFAGSGTTLAVAEKLGRRWIGVDCGKLAIYTMQKRLLNIAESKNLENKKLSKAKSGSGGKYGKPCKPFTLFNAGLYDYKMIKELPWEQYRDFALKLFQCRDEKHDISKIGLDGYLGADSVMVFNYQKHKDAVMDRGFIDDLHQYLGDKIGRRFFIIAPAASVQFLEDYIEKGKIRYYVLRIPYSIIEEIHKRGFTKIKQPVSEMDVNDTVDAVGFDFIQTPTVECKYYLDKPKKRDLFTGKSKECVIKIGKFESKVISRKPMEFKNLETLSMVMLDYDFNGEVFDLDEVFYAEDLKKSDYELRFPSAKIKDQMMIIYIDIFGNEKREVKTLKDFRQTKI